MSKNSDIATPAMSGLRTRGAICIALGMCLVTFVFATTTNAATLIAGAGTGAGQVEDPNSAAVDQANGTLFIGENDGTRVDEFDPTKPSSEAFVRAFGWGVRDGSEELQTCTAVTGCLRGASGSAGGQIRPGGMAVDPATHNIYVSDYGHYRVEEFTPAGEFVLTFGREVNKTTHGDVCTAASHDNCGAGITGTGPGAFDHTGLFPYLPLAFDPAGHVWVGDVNRVEEFSAAGVFLSEVKLPGEGSISALAVDTAGNFYSLSDSELKGGSRVRKYDASGSPLNFTSLGTNVLDESGNPLALALDGSGHVYVGDQATGDPYRFLEFDAVTGAQVEAFGAGEVIGQPGNFKFGGSIALGAASQLYAASSTSPSAVQSFAPPPPGPLVRDLLASPIHGTSATLNAILNAEGAETHYRFQYLTQQQFEADGDHFGAGTEESAEATLPAGFSEPEVSALITGLSGETEYRFRLLAENSNGKGNTEESQATFTTSPPVSIDSVFATGVSATAATLNAEINPLGTPSEYRFEYLTEAAYQENVAASLDPFTGAQLAPQPDGQLGSGEEDVTVAQSLQGLVPDTTYRYRVTAHNSGGSRSPLAHSFSTQAIAPLSLLDDRGWELVSPPDKRGALFKPIAEAGVVQAAAEGGAISYLSSNPTEADPQGFANQVQILSARGTHGWVSRDLSLPNLSPTGLSIGVGQEYRYFSEDLSQSIIQPFLHADLAAISPLATEVTPFLRSDFPAGSPTDFCEGSCYRPMVTGAEGVADVPPGTEFSADPLCKGLCGPAFIDATPSGEDVLLESQVGLTEVPGDEGGLYEWSSEAQPTEALQLVSILPNGQPVGPGANFRSDIERNAISSDGTRVVWNAGAHLYLRDMGKAETIQIDKIQQGASGQGTAEAVFQGASSDGSRVLFTDQQALTPGAGAGSGERDLYECRLQEVEGQLHCSLADLTPATGGEHASVQGIVLGFSGDASSVYFVANGVLAGNTGADGSHASPGQCRTGPIPPGSTCNLYVSHDGSLSFIATLSGEDGPTWGNGIGGLPGLTARVSPNGEWLAFMSQRSLTGYDNHDAVTGQPDEEVFVFHAAGSGSLVCASCNPTGGRPRGVEFAQIGADTGHLAGGDRVWPADTRLAANIPGWTPYRSGRALHQPRYLSNDGRLFFNAVDALAPKDSNGTEDVYEYEPPSGEGASSNTCSEASATFSAAAGGCVDLVSSGTSGEESALLDASESGDDVFFLSAARLAPRDEDGAIDVYDARVAGGEPQPVPPVQCEGDGCQQPVNPPLDQTPGSLTFHGAGNVHEKATAKKHKKRKRHHHKGKPHVKRHRSANRGGSK